MLKNVDDVFAQEGTDRFRHTVGVGFLFNAHLEMRQRERFWGHRG